MPKDKLYISVYENDDEAWDIWTKEMGVEESHMKRLGKEDNFWEHGSGPCGPCSEIYFDRGRSTAAASPPAAWAATATALWRCGNLVFSQFNNDGHGNYTDLVQKNIDTGMGLERLACVMQDVDNLFLVDTVQNIMKKITEIAGVHYGDDPKKDVSLRVITDHIRSTVFMIGDGVLPSNEGRGYVLRRLLRRAARHGKLLGIQGAFLKDVVDTVIQENEKAYPELLEKRETIKKIVSFEEESFQKTIDQGMALLNDLIDKADSKVFSGDNAFTLNDTYGFPLDLTKEILAERGMQVDEERFRQLMQEQRERARSARKDAGADAWKGEGSAASGLEETVFTGYTQMEGEGKVTAIIQNGQRVDSAAEGAEVSVVLDTTPFYGEGGGQVGDTGILEAEGVSVDVVDTSKHEGVYLHRAVVSEGSLRVGDVLTAKVDSARREAIMRNHTAAHLLQAALRKVLGDHVEQAGQLVIAGLLPGSELAVKRTVVVGTQGRGKGLGRRISRFVPAQGIPGLHQGIALFPVGPLVHGAQLPSGLLGLLCQSSHGQNGQQHQHCQQQAPPLCDPLFHRLSSPFFPPAQKPDFSINSVSIIPESTPNVNPQQGSPAGALTGKFCPRVAS